MKPASATNAIKTRVDTTHLLLNSLVEGIPRLQIHPRCRMLRKGFQTGYRYRRRKGVRSELEGQLFDEEPIKNKYSHVHDACQHLFIGEGMFRELTGRQHRHVAPGNVRAAWNPYDRSVPGDRAPRLRNL